MRAPRRDPEIPRAEGVVGGGVHEGISGVSAAGSIELGWRRVLVYGLGLSGRSAAELLRHLGVAVLGIDGRSGDEVVLGDLAADPEVRLLLGGEPEELPADEAWDGLDAVVVSPGVPAERPLLRAARERGLPVLGEVELAHRCLVSAFPESAFPNPARILGITGSNGKSTTTALTAAMLKAGGLEAEACGNIGQPLAAVVLEALNGIGEGDGPPICVVELSSFQLDTIEHFRPRAAALLNFSPDHLDRHGDFAAYRAAKLRLFARQEADDLAVLNADDPLVAEAATGLAGRVRRFSRRGPVADGCWADGDRVLEVGPGLEEPLELFRTSDSRLRGVHNLENAMAAALLARACGVEPSAIRRGLGEVGGLPHRLEQVRERAGVVWFDDSKGTNPAATLKSLEGFEDGRVLLILGGIFKGGDLSELCEVVARKARRAYLIGEAAEIFDRQLRSMPGMTTELVRTGTLERAVAEADRDARPGDVVVLSPACSSFDQFANFAQRGRVFQSLVHALGEVDHGA